jgi:hypothetical protein
MRAILVYSFPLWLLLLGILLLLLSGPPVLRRKALDAKQIQFKSLRTTSPILNTLIMISVVGKPFLEHLQKSNWDTGFIDPQIVMPLVWVFIVSLYALLAAVIIFFFRAIRNINVLSGERLRSPYSALFMLVPISNMVVIPYLEYFAYQRSRALATPHQASKIRSVVLVVAAFALLLVSLALGLPTDDPSQPGTYDPLALLVLSLCTGCASGILTTRIINGIFAAQDLLAERIMGHGREASVAEADERKRRIETLKLDAVVLLLIVAAVTALFPSLPSHVVAEVFHS